MTDISREETDAERSKREKNMEARLAVSEQRTEARIGAAEQQMGARIEGLEQRMETRVGGAEQRMGARIGGAEQQMGARIGGVEQQLGARIGRAEQQMGARIDGAEQQIGARIDGLEQRMETRIAALKPGRVQRYAPGISAAAAVLALGVGGWYYITQVGLTQHSLQNSLIYQMQKDQRAVVMDYASGRSGPEYIFADMQSIFIQHSLDSIPERLWPLFVRDFCNLMTRENFRRTWEDISKTGAFSEDFIAFVDRAKDPGVIRVQESNEMTATESTLGRCGRLMMLSSYLAGLVWFTAVRAEYSEGIGQISGETAEASAKFNDALTEFHAMLASLNRRQTEEAERHRTQVLVLLRQTANAYEATKADGHTLSPSARTPEEQEFIEYFRVHAANYGVAIPTTQSGLVLATSRLIREFESRVAATNATRLRQNMMERQSLSNSSADLQKFLISATTMLTLG